MIGVLAIGSLREPPLVRLVEALGSLGYVEGRTVAFEQPPSGGSYETLQRLAAHLVESKVDLIVTFGATATTAASRATRSTPIVMILGSDPVELGIVQSLAHPGGNVTGILTISQDLAGKRFEQMREIIPALSRVAVLLDPASKTEVLSLRRTQAAAAQWGIVVVPAEARSAVELQAAFDAIERRGAEALIPVSSTMLLDNRALVAKLAIEHRLPAICVDRAFAEAGALMSYGPDFSAALYRVASYVDRILKGASPADLPVEQPTRFELVINLKTAKALGLTIPPTLLTRADEVIE